MRRADASSKHDVGGSVYSRDVMVKTTNRPKLSSALTAEEFSSWYWLSEELQQFSRRAGISANGVKSVLTARVRAHLAGELFSEPTVRKLPVKQLTGDLEGDTLIPAGHRCTQHLRAWFTDQVGPSFRFDSAMRDFFAANTGDSTLGDALEHWRATRTDAPRPISEQFEYNRFTRAWRSAHPESDREELLAAWRDYRDKPMDQRSRA